MNIKKELMSLSLDYEHDDHVCGGKGYMIRREDA